MDTGSAANQFLLSSDDDDDAARTITTRADKQLVEYYRIDNSVYGDLGSVCIQEHGESALSRTVEALSCRDGWATIARPSRRRHEGQAPSRSLHDQLRYQVLLLALAKWVVLSLKCSLGLGVFSHLIFGGSSTTSGSKHILASWRRRRRFCCC